MKIQIRFENEVEDLKTYKSYKLCKKCSETKPGLHIIGRAATILVSLLVLCFLFTGFTISRTLMINKDHSFLYEEIMRDYRDDAKATQIAEECGLMTDDIEQAGCVLEKVITNYTPVQHAGMRSPTETIMEGGLCRDYAVTYAIIFEKLGWKYNFVSVTYHVFLNIHKEDVYCNIDQTELNCHLLG